MFHAIKFKQTNHVRQLLQKINNFEQQDEDGNTFLNAAVQSGQFETVTLLQEKHVNINTKNHLGNSPLHYAKAYTYNRIFRHLIDSGADEEVTNNGGRTPWEGI